MNEVDKRREALDELEADCNAWRKKLMEMQRSEIILHAVADFRRAGRYRLAMSAAMLRFLDELQEDDV